MGIRRGVKDSLKDFYYNGGAVFPFDQNVELVFETKPHSHNVSITALSHEFGGKEHIVAIRKKEDKLIESLDRRRIKFSLQTPTHKLLRRP